MTAKEDDLFNKRLMFQRYIRLRKLEDFVTPAAGRDTNEVFRQRRKKDIAELESTFPDFRETYSRLIY